MFDHRWILRHLRLLTALLRERGVTVPLVTSDGPEDHMLSGGSIPGALATVNFGSPAREAFETLRRHRPGGPLMCMEFWCGWFDHWGGEHVTRDAGDAAAALREILECGAALDLYMAHGGTSFAGWAGANRGGGALHEGPLEPDVTSYDYDAPIDEYGRPTEKFWRLREVLAAYAPGPLPEPPPAPPLLRGQAPVRLSGRASLAAVVDRFGGPERAEPVPPTFEELDVDRGVVRYEVTVPGPRQPYPLTARGLRNLAVVYVDGERAGVLAEGDERLADPVAGHARVELWVESLGRVNYGPRGGEPKGVTGGLLHERQYLHGVRARGLRLDALDDITGLELEPLAADGAPGLYRGTAAVRGAGDARLELPGWTRGFAWVNGFSLGRYWSAGPQRPLYVPGPVLREGENEVWLLELEEAAPDTTGSVTLRTV